MQELEKMVALYHTLRTVCLILGMIFLGLTIFLFFKFKIKSILDIKTGRSQKKTIEKMEQMNALTGKLRQDMVPHTSPNLASEERVTYPKTAPNLQVTNQDYTTPLEQNTGVQGEDESIQETTLLNDVSQTTVLSEEIQSVCKELPGMFEIKKELLWVHTQEML